MGKFQGTPVAANRLQSNYSEYAFMTAKSEACVPPTPNKIGEGTFHGRVGGPAQVTKSGTGWSISLKYFFTSSMLPCCKCAELQ